MKICLLCLDILLRYPHFLQILLVCLTLYDIFVPWQEAFYEEEPGGLDPNRPRFTLQELRDVLHERNELKAKVFLLQEELAYYKRYCLFNFLLFIIIIHVVPVTLLFTLR